MDQLAFSCSLTAVLLHRVRRAAGDDAQQALLHAAGSPRTLEYLMDLGNWVSYDEVIALWEAGAELTGDPQFARHIGEDFVGRLAGSGNSAVLRQLGSPEGLVRKIALAGHRFSTASDLAAGEVREGYVLERPERLGSTLELVDRLSGVAAHAVTALENGRLVDHITFQARHDQLTGATNRAGFHEVLTASLHEDASVALFYVDLDDFKPVNDEHGHDVGDALLRAVAQRLGECVRAGDTVARLGGDEFAVVVGDVAREEQLAAISHRLERAFREPFTAAGRTFRIGASIGRAVWAGEGAHALLRRADGAMYAAKRSGGGTVVAA